MFLWRLCETFTTETRRPQKAVLQKPAWTIFNIRRASVLLIVLFIDIRDPRPWDEPSGSKPALEKQDPDLS